MLDARKLLNQLISNGAARIEGLAAAVDSLEHAAEGYAASALVLHPASPAEQFYLDSLARGLGLELGLAPQLESVVASSATA